MDLPDIAGFRQVDQADPEFLLRFLDAARRIESVQALKRVLLELLEVRAGHHLLDVGCGTGDDAIELAGLVGATGRVVGIDSSAVMIAEARRRAERAGLPVEFFQADAHHLDFPDASFDGCRAERVLLYVANPEQLVAEMVRVTRPGGRIVIFDFDYDSVSIDSSNRALTRAIIHLASDRVPNGCIGRQLPRLFRRAGLEQVRAIPQAIMLPFEMLVRAYKGSLQAAQEEGLVSAEAVGGWWKELEEKAAKGDFCAAVYGFVVVGVVRAAHP